MQDLNKYLAMNYPSTKGKTPTDRAIAALEHMDQELGQYSATTERLKEELDAVKELQQRTHGDYIAEMQKNGSRIGDGMKILKLEHTLEVVALIAEGNTAEAIKSLLRSDVVLFNVDVRFADDKSHEAARKEWYDRGKADAIKAIEAATLENKVAG